MKSEEKSNVEHWLWESNIKLQNWPQVFTVWFGRFEHPSNKSNRKSDLVTWDRHQTAWSELVDLNMLD